ncbi:hypothetical protein [Vibrio phage vB_VruC_PG21]|uniref:Uncharacterized protein n=1 Tax=Vibrio phage vB_VruC_PG21 TaxID=2928757 RepID=A0AAE9KFH0_9VIRU|nr:hypothetical protein [Vibrio sp. CK2-1]MCF7355071.1 hypothetical protein [Vibrio sp. CK2-1]UOL48291.1 hypothetical protein [Vibrio phage vB_VruC_PG21]
MTFTIWGFFLASVFWFIWEMKTLLRWKKELKHWEAALMAHDRDLRHRESVLKQIQLKIKKEKKWKWMI